MDDHENPSLDTLFEIQSRLVSEIWLESVILVMAANVHILC